jgi:hypothetical protein
MILGRGRNPEKCTDQNKLSFNYFIKNISYLSKIEKIACNNFCKKTFKIFFESFGKKFPL